MIETTEFQKITSFIRILLRFKTFIFSTVIFFVLSTFIYNTFATKIYRGSTTFFIISETNNASSLLSSIPFGNFSMQGIDMHIFSIIQSEKMQHTIADELKRLLNVSSKEEAMSTLNLYKNTSIQKNKNNLFTLSFYHPSPPIIEKVLNAYIQNISNFNKELSLTPQKEIIKLLDKPTVYKKPYKPQKTFNLIAAFVLSLMVAILLVILKTTLNHIKKDLI